MHVNASPGVPDTHISSTPTQAECSLVGEQFPETEHHAVDEWEEEIDGRAAEEGPEGWGLVYYHGTGGCVIIVRVGG